MPRYHAYGVPGWHRTPQAAAAVAAVRDTVLEAYAEATATGKAPEIATTSARLQERLAADGVDAAAARQIAQTETTRLAGEAPAKSSLAPGFDW